MEIILGLIIFPWPDINYGGQPPTHSTLASTLPRLRPGEAWVVTGEASVSVQRLPRTATKGDTAAGMPRRKGSGDGGCEDCETDGAWLRDHKYSLRPESVECEPWGKREKLSALKENTGKISRTPGKY